MIKIINKLLNETLIADNTIYVLKGFNSIIDFLELKIDHIFNLKINENFFNLENCGNKLFQMGSDLMNNKEPFFCLYEEMYFVSIYLPGLLQLNNYKVIIVDIGIFENYYPGFKNIDNNIIINKFDNDNLEKNNFIQQVYINCFIENNNLVIQYNQIDEGLIFNYIKLFSTYSECLKSFSYAEEKEILLYDNSTPQSLVYVFNNLFFCGYNTINLIYLENNKNNYIYKFVSILNFFGIQ